MLIAEMHMCKRIPECHSHSCVLAACWPKSVSRSDVSVGTWATLAPPPDGENPCFRCRPGTDGEVGNSKHASTLDTPLR